MDNARTTKRSFWATLNSGLGAINMSFSAVERLAYSGERLAATAGKHADRVYENADRALVKQSREQVIEDLRWARDTMKEYTELGIDTSEISSQIKELETAKNALVIQAPQE